MIFSAVRHIVIRARAFLVHTLNKWRTPRYLNIGGGPWFVAKDWINLDAVRSPVNAVPFHFTPRCTFPTGNERVELVYSSHAIEHLDSETLDRVLKESHRVLKPGGRLVLKIPDYDHALECWKKRDTDFFYDEIWGIDAVAYTWPNRGVPDTLDYRAAMIFCGFWNKAYGDHFSKNIRIGKTAYHGPPVVSEAFLRNLQIGHSPAGIAAELRKVVVAGEPNYCFNHQNAWSRSELSALLQVHDFTVSSIDSDAIMTACWDIPGIREMARISLYIYAEKTSSRTRS